MALWPAYRSPRGQVALLGVIFLLNFTAFSTIQAFAANLYGTTLGANVNSTIYAVFTVACFLSPSITNKVGSRRTMVLGIGGYAALVAASLGYFLSQEAAALRSLVIAGAGVLGFGAALLWTAQGRLMLQYARIHGNHGELLALFWGIFNASAIVGGLFTFAYFSGSQSRGNAALYAVFLGFIGAAAALCGAVVPPRDLASDSSKRLSRPSRDLEADSALPEDTSNRAMPTRTGDALGESIAEDARDPLLAGGSSNIQGHLAPAETCAEEEVSLGSWTQELSETLALFRGGTIRSLSCLFFYSGFCQGYQLNGFTRFFDQATLGLEICVFYAAEIAAAFLIGHVLDQQRSHTSQSSVGYRILAAVILLGLAPAGLSLRYELEGGKHEALSYRSVDVALPTLTFACFGFSDAVIQTYAYWLLGKLFASGSGQARAVGIFKLLQSFGFCVGFALVPSSRCPHTVQLLLSAGLLVVGSLLAMRKDARPSLAPP